MTSTLPEPVIATEPTTLNCPKATVISVIVPSDQKGEISLTYAVSAI